MNTNERPLDDTSEARFAGELRCDVRPLNLLDGVDFDQPNAGAVVTVADFHAGAVPDAHAAGDVAAQDAGSQALGEVHQVGIVPASAAVDAPNLELAVSSTCESRFNFVAACGLRFAIRVVVSAKSPSRFATLA